MKKVVTFALAASLCIGGLPISTYAASTTDAPKRVTVLEMLAQGEDAGKGLVTDAILVDEDCNATTSDGESIDLSDAIGISKAKIMLLSKTGYMDTYLEKQGYDVYYAEDGSLLIDLSYQSGRIFVGGTDFSDYYGALSMAESGGVTLLEYASASKAKEAAEIFTEDGYEVCADPIMEMDATSYTYTSDVLGQYGQSVKESSGTNTITLAPELMGLTYGAANIVDAQSTTTIKSVGVAVIDSGVDTTSSVLTGRVRSGYNVLNASTNTSDNYGHGTFIASEIANNTPSNVGIIPIKVTDETGTFTASRLAAALQYLVSNSAGVNVVNLSLSICTLDSTQMDQLTSFINPYIDALYEKGILIVTSAGNYSASYPSMTANDSYPANYDKCIAVGALANSNGTWQAYSQSLKGSCIDYWAPGKFIRGAKATAMSMTQATAGNSWTGEWLDLGDGTCVMSGTSQATAFVTAAIAQILSYDNNLSSAEQTALLRKNSTSAGASGTYPEMSGYFYTIGSYNSSTGGYSGVVSDWDVLVDTSAGTITLVKYTGSGSSVNIPATYTVNGRTLKTVMGNSTATSGPFANNTVIKSVTFEDGVIARNNDASYMFYGCTGLSSVNKIPDDVVNTSYMFYGCTGLLQYPTVPSKVTTMNYMFYNCKNASGTSTISSPNVSSGMEAYTNDTAILSVPANSTTYATFSKLIDKWSKVTMSGAEQQETSAGVSLNASSATVGIGKTYTLIATTNGTGTQTITWSSNAPAVATVNSNGVVTGVSTGTAIITATCGSYKATCSVQVGGNSDGTNGSDGTSGSPSETVKQYIVTFYYRNVNVNKVSGGKVVTKKTNARGYVSQPKNPTKTGYYFAGWYTKNGSTLTRFSFEDTQLTKDTKLYAKWISTKIGSTSITSLKKVSSKKLKVTYKKAANATHYQIFVSSYKNFQGGAVVRTTKTSRVVKVLTSYKKYVKVRACRKLGSKWYYGKWSAVKTITP